MLIGHAAHRLRIGWRARAGQFEFDDRKARNVFMSSHTRHKSSRLHQLCCWLMRLPSLRCVKEIMPLVCATVCDARRSGRRCTGSWRAGVTVFACRRMEGRMRRTRGVVNALPSLRLCLIAELAVHCATCNCGSQPQLRHSRHAQRDGVALFAFL